MQHAKKKVEAALNPEEVILSAVYCSLEIFRKRFIPRSGLLAATSERMLFCEEGAAAPESYSYEHVSYFMKEESTLGYKLFARYGTTLVRLQYMHGENPERFTDVLQQQICPSLKQ